MHPLLHLSVAGTRLPALVLDGQGAGESYTRVHPVPSPGARWTLLVLGDDARGQVAEHRARLAAEAVAAVAVTDRPDVDGTVLVDPQGVVQHVGASVEEALDAVRTFRTGELVPVPFAASRAPGACPDAGRRRRATARSRRPAP